MNPKLIVHLSLKAALLLPLLAEAAPAHQAPLAGNQPQQLASSIQIEVSQIRIPRLPDSIFNPDREIDRNDRRNRNRRDGEDYDVSDRSDDYDTGNRRGNEDYDVDDRSDDYDYE